MRHIPRSGLLKKVVPLHQDEQEERIIEQETTVPFTFSVSQLSLEELGLYLRCPKTSSRVSRRSYHEAAKKTSVNRDVSVRKERSAEARLKRYQYRKSFHTPALSWK